MYKLTVIISCCFFLFIIWIIYLANTAQPSLFFELVKIIPYGDKVGHFVLFGTLTLCVNVASKFKVFKLGTIDVFWGTAAVFVFATVEELSQYLIPTRTLDMHDYIADMVGIILFTWLSRILLNSSLITTRGHS
ncbi:VanZ family protein [Pseudoalteromonas sp. R3]|uniref:VanZ family protein n=1 Tax=Pseudoalteromonas sp. R3 TaxID=1709477 RepID=UPI0006B68928|nr:VanZ family protein [Pseudoalteromonas sp. R3]AZZ98211.1 trypsin [Pseudoalteromonas sp. R3]